MGVLKPKAIFIVGPSSCGKTTLCDALASHYGIPPSRHIKEVARSVMKTQGFSRKDVGTLEMQLAIMKAQLKAERKARKRWRTNSTHERGILFLSDRSAVDPIVYAGMNETAASREMEHTLCQNPEFQRTVCFYRESIFILLPFVPEWVFDDGIRSLESPDKYFNKIKEVLDRLGVEYTQIDTDVQSLEERIAVVDSCLARRDS